MIGYLTATLRLSSCPSAIRGKLLGFGALQLKGLGSPGQSDLVCLFCFPFSVSLTSRFSDYLRSSVPYLFSGSLSLRSVGSNYRMRLPLSRQVT